MNPRFARISRAASPVHLLALAAPALAGAQVVRIQDPPDEESRQVHPVKSRVTVIPVGRSYLGVALINITEELREFFGAPEDAGVLVSQVAEDSPAAEAGFRVGDVITRVGDRDAESSRDVVRAVGRLDPEETVSVEVIRAGAPLTLDPVLGEREGSVWFSGNFQLPDMEFQVLRDQLPRVMIQSEEAREAMRKAIKQARAQMVDLDVVDLVRRLSETEDRLRELERKLSEREP